MKNEKVNASFAVTPKTAKITAREHDKYLVKLEMALNLCVEDRNRKRVPNDGSVFVAPESTEPI